MSTRDNPVRPGSLFVIVDISTPGGHWVDRTIYDSVEAADRDAEALMKKGRKVQVIDALWFSPSREVLVQQGLVGRWNPPGRSPKWPRSAMPYDARPFASTAGLLASSSPRGVAPDVYAAHDSALEIPVGVMYPYEGEYAYWVADAHTGLVLSGWEYREDALDEHADLKEYLRNAGRLGVYTLAGVRKKQRDAGLLRQNPSKSRQRKNPRQSRGNPKRKPALKWSKRKGGAKAEYDGRIFLVRSDSRFNNYDMSVFDGFSPSDVGAIHESTHPTLASAKAAANRFHRGERENRSKKSKTRR